MKYSLHTKTILTITWLFSTILFLSCDNHETDNTPIIGEMPSNVIKKIVVDNNGLKWILTSKRIVTFYSGNWEYHSDLETLNKYKINDIALGSPNHILVSSLNGAFDLTISNDKVETVTEYSKSICAIASDSVWTACAGLNGELYLGTSAGLLSYSNNEWKSFDGYLDGGRTDGIKKLIEYRTTAIAVAKNNWGYACTKGAGIFRFNAAVSNNQIDASTGATVYTKQWSKGLGSDIVFTILITNDTCQWVGTTNGVSYHTTLSTRYDWIHYSRTNGLICDSVLSIAKDDEGNMWFGTYRGISKFDGRNWINFSTKDGLVNNKVNTIAVDIDESLWFGTDSGLSHYDHGKFDNFTKNN